MMTWPEAMTLATFGPGAVERLFGPLHSVAITFTWPDGVELVARSAVRARRRELVGAKALAMEIPAVDRGWIQARVDVQDTPPRAGAGREEAS